MLINRKTWILFITLSIFSAIVWFYLTYPQLSFINLSIDRPRALAIAKNYITQERGIDLTGYRHAVVFAVAGSPDQYLQKAVGFKEEIKFFKKHDY